MNRELRRISIDEMLAYVDGCLPREHRVALEDRMIEYPEIRGQIDLWLLQNQAIRAAFPDPSFRPASTVGADFASRGHAADQARQGLKAIREGKDLVRRPEAADPIAESLPRPVAAPFAPARLARPKRNAAAAARRVVLTLGGAFALCAASAIVVSNSHSEAFAKAAAAAYRTFADNRARPVEIATSDRDALNQWFAPQIVRAEPIPDLAASGLVLLGGRIVPGVLAPAEFLLYENARHDRIALEIEAADAPPKTDVEIGESGDVLCASWTGAGRSFAIIGRASRAQMMELARLVREGRPKG